MIQEKVKQGMYLKDIAAELGVHPRARRSKLDPYKPLVDRLLGEGVWNAVVIWREIQAQGYPGGATILRDYIRPKRALRPSRTTVRFETEPGRQLRNDWGEIKTVIGGIRQKVLFAVNTLGYSRRSHFFAARAQDAEHTYEGLIRAFEYFGGCPEEVLIDNQKAAVIEHRIGAALRFNARFLDLAGDSRVCPATGCCF